MLDLMYTVPSQHDVSEIVITEDVVLNRHQPAPLKKAV
jgi:ATP-dependent protease Clp ATPase subunit